MAEQPVDEQPEKNPAADEIRSLTIDWKVPDDAIPAYATNMLVQHTEHEFIIYFFNVRPPVLPLGPEEVVRAHAEGIVSVPANLVSMIMIAADRMPFVIQALIENWQRYQATYGTEDTENAEEQSLT